MSRAATFVVGDHQLAVKRHNLGLHPSQGKSGPWWLRMSITDSADPVRVEQDRLDVSSLGRDEVALLVGESSSSANAFSASSSAASSR